MFVFMDRSFCSLSGSCNAICDRRLTDELKEKAKKWSKRPLISYSNFENCNEWKKIKGDNDEKTNSS